MDKIVFALCTLTSLSCAVLLFRGYTQSRSRLLVWSAAGFILIAISNMLLYADKFLVPDLSLLGVRTLFTLSGVVVLLFGLIWENQ